MARRRYRFPLTSHMMRQSPHDIMVRMAENKADSGGVILRIKRSIVADSATAVEKFTQWRLEIKLESENGGKRITVRIEDIGVDASVPRARIDAAMGIYLNAKAVRRVAVRCGLGGLLLWIDGGGLQRLEAMLRERHAHIHSFSHEYPDDVGACRTAEAVLRAGLDDRPIDRAAAKLIEGRFMEMAGRGGEARAAYETALEDCKGCKGGGKEGALALVCSGHALAHLGRDEEAEAALWDAVKADPGSHLAYLELGHLALLAGRHADAGRMYARAIEIDPSYAPARVFQGHVLLVVDVPGGGRAAGYYEAGLALDPHDVSAHVGWGLDMAAQGLHAEAAEHFKEGMRIDPDDAAPRVALGHAMAALGRDADAAGAYEEAIEMGAGLGIRGGAAGRAVDRTIRLRFRLGGVSAHVGLAGAMARMGRGEEALARYREAADLDGGSAEAHAGAARMLAALGQWEAAIPEYRAAIEIDPRSARAHLGLADALLNAGRPEEAAYEYRAAIEIDPRSARAHLGLASALSKAGRPEEAAYEYRAAIEIDPRSARAHLGLADALLNAGRPEEAAYEYRAAIEIDPRSARAHLGLASALSKAGRPEEAAYEYRAAIEIDPRSARAHLGLADALLNAGRPEEAAYEYRAAIEIDPRSARAHLGLASALSAEKMTIEAQRAYERAVELDPGIGG